MKPNQYYKSFENFLFQNGWYSDRKIDITQAKKYIEKEFGYIFNKYIIFMEQFGNLKFILKDGYGTVIRIPLICKCCVDADIAQQYQTLYTKSLLLPIGTMSGENNDLLIDENGIFYAVNGQFVKAYGDDFLSVLNDIYNQKIYNWINLNTLIC
jgi:hypothetical protein